MKLLNEPYFIYASSSTTSSNFGTVFASASNGSIYMQNDIGELYPLTESKGYFVITEYTSSGTFIWSKPGGIAFAQVICVGGGGGGGGGARAAASSTRGSGAGGQAGAIALRWFSSASLTTSSYTITVGGGGTAGNSGSGNGTAGGNGGTTSFVSASTTLISANGGVGGPAGIVTGTGGGVASTNPTSVTPNSAGNYFFFKMTAGDGGTSLVNYPADGLNTPFSAFNGYFGVGAGGGGGGITSANVLIAGGSGSSTWNYSSLIATGSPGGAGDGVSGNDGVNYLVNGLSLAGFSSSFTSSYGIGTPGHGGGSGNLAGTINGGNGGNGGNFGAGGGGGGAGTTSAQAGRGGTGGGGYVLIIEYY